MFKAFADKTRLRILQLLTQGELCVCDLMATLKLPQSKVSRHLAYLKASGLVNDRRVGLWKYYKLAAPAGKFHARLVYCLKICFDEVRILQLDRARLKKQRKAKGC